MFRDNYFNFYGPDASVSGLFDFMVLIGYNMKVLFICSQNKRRSLTAEKLLDGRNGCEVRSAGTETNARIKVTAGMLGWADIIFCMEKKHLRRIREKYADILWDKHVICLNIPDDFEYMDEELQDILIGCAEEYIWR